MHTEIGVGAPAPIVWGLLTALDRWPDWNPVMRVAGRLAPGAPLEVALTPPGKPAVVVKATVTRLEDGRELRWLGRLWLPGLCDAEHGFRVVAEDVGRCRFEQFEVFRGLLAGIIVGPRAKELETGFQVMNRMLKREAEKVARERA